MSQRHRVLQVGLQEGLVRMSQVALWPSFWLLKEDVRGQSGEGQGAGWLVSASERCKIPFPTCSCLENRQEAAVLVLPCCWGSRLPSGKGSLRLTKKHAVHDADRDWDSNHKITVPLA